MQPPALIALDEEIIPKMFVMECEVIILGRDEGTCKIFVPNSKVSRLHASIKREGRYCYLQDLKSTNGTFVNERRIQPNEPYLLKNQDKIGLGPGPALLLFEDADTTELVFPLVFYDDKKMKFFVNNQPLDLAPKEFRLFYHLYKHMGELCLHKGCAEAVWEEREFDPLTDVEGLHRLVTRIRDKLGEAKHILVSRHGMGYQLEF
jgi:DNA-binding response OmpR family regulator